MFFRYVELLWQSKDDVAKEAGFQSLALTVALSICYIRQANIWCCRLWVCISFAQAERKYQVIHQVLARASFWPFWRRHVTFAKCQ